MRQYRFCGTCKIKLKKIENKICGICERFLNMNQEKFIKLENNGQKFVLPENSLKELLVNYVGLKLKPEDDKVTLEMVLEVLADEFSELVLHLAEQNWIYGYKKCLADIEDFKIPKKEIVNIEQT